MSYKPLVFIQIKFKLTPDRRAQSTSDILIDSLLKHVDFKNTYLFLPSFYVIRMLRINFVIKVH